MRLIRAYIDQILQVYKTSYAWWFQNYRFKIKVYNFEKCEYAKQTIVG